MMTQQNRYLSDPSPMLRCLGNRADLQRISSRPDLALRLSTRPRLPLHRVARREHPAAPIRAKSQAIRHLEIIVNEVLSPTTLMCPLQGAVSSTRSTSPGPKRRVSPSVVVTDMTPWR